MQPQPVVVRHAQPAGMSRLPPMRSTRPVLAIDTAPPHTNGNGHLPVQRSGIVNGEPLSSQLLSAAGLQDLSSPKTATSSSQCAFFIFERLPLLVFDERGSYVSRERMLT